MAKMIGDPLYSEEEIQEELRFKRLDYGVYSRGADLESALRVHEADLRGAKVEAPYKRPHWQNRDGSLAADW